MGLQGGVCRADPFAKSICAGLVEEEVQRLKGGCDSWGNICSRRIKGPADFEFRSMISVTVCRGCGRTS